MRSQLSATLLKAVLQVHEIVATMDQHLSRDLIAAHGMDAVVEELKLRTDLKWKQKQVSVFINVIDLTLVLGFSIC